jgi:hypothetical protein
MSQIRIFPKEGDVTTPSDESFESVIVATRRCPGDLRRVRRDVTASKKENSIPLFVIKSREYFLSYGFVSIPADHTANIYPIVNQGVSL